MMPAVPSSSAPAREEDRSGSGAILPLGVVLVAAAAAMFLYVAGGHPEYRWICAAGVVAGLIQLGVALVGRRR
jgi:hypothetical protein